MESVSIIVPAWNEARVLRRTLEALLDIDYDKRQCEVIVVAGGHDNTYEIAKDLAPTMRMFSRYVVVPQLPHGKNAAIQAGIKEAKNNIIVLLDADTIASKHWLKSMVYPIEQGDCDLTIANPTAARKSWVSDYYMIIKAYFLDVITMFSGHSMAFRSNDVESLLEYFFDRDFKVGVDYVLAKKFQEQGKRIRFAKDAVVITNIPSSFRYFVLTELRWLTARINIDGVSYRTFLCNSAVTVGALILTIPLSKTLFILALLFNVTYIIKRVHIFLMSSRHCSKKSRNFCGFIVLSYAYHVIGLISYIRYFLGFPKESYLSQGERY